MIVPTTGSVSYAVGSVPLPAYLVHHQWVNECAFWGVGMLGQKTSCIWTQHQRNQLYHYLCVAHEKLKACLGYWLMPEYTINERVTLLDERMRCTVRLKCKYVHALGREKWDTLFSGAVVDYSSDPATITITGNFAGTDCNEIVICHPGTKIPIDPSGMDVSADGTTLSISIPWCRLVTIEKSENGFSKCCPECVYCPDLPARCLEETVDIKRRYTAGPAVCIMCAPGCSCQKCCQKPCEISYEPGCGVVLDGKNGIIHINPQNVCSCCTGKRYALVSYKSGKIGYDGRYLDGNKSAIEMISRLAHALMPKNPCGDCSQMTDLWMRDREINPNANFSTPFGGRTNGELHVYNWVRGLPDAGSEMIVI